MTETFLTVRYSETDRMGIVHHSRYYPWFEIARGDFIKQIGLKYSELEAKGIMMPLIETGAKYHGSCTYEDEVVIEKHMGFSLVSDERFCDGLYYALALRDFRKVMRNPAVLETPLEKKVEDIE